LYYFRGLETLLPPNIVLFQGFGDPAPSLHWFREHGLLPTGEQTQEGERFGFLLVLKIQIFC